jgi:acetyl-CoA carboxylase carboxyl transferase subunit alpha
MSIIGYTGTYELDFERPLIQLEKQITELEDQSAGPPAHGSAGTASADTNVDLRSEIKKLRENHTQMLRKIYEGLGPWDTVKVARHPGRPQSVDYIRHMVKDFCQLHGDRLFGDDPAILTGFGRIGQHKVLIVAHNKGKDTKQRISTNWGMAHPEGYRKAMLKMKLAEKFGLPIVTLIDTPGAYPGIGAEERGQAQAIANNLLEMSRLKTPVVAVVIGEGGSGGALGIGVCDRMAMMQYAWFSVISPEGCAAILWKTDAEAVAAAQALKLTSKDNLKNKIIDHIIEEPLGGAHRDPQVCFDGLEKWLIQTLRELKRFKPDNLVNRRFERLRRMGRPDGKS